MQSPIFSAILTARLVVIEEEATMEIPHIKDILTISVAILPDMARKHVEKSIACISPYPMHITQAE